MSCTTVRGRLTEHALGALPARDAMPVDRHLTWCAGCRKEAGELQRASATLGFALAPEGLPAGLEDRVVGAVQTAASPRGAHSRSTPRRSRLTLVAALAAMLAVLGTGWGAVMAGRAARSDREAKLEEIRSESAIERFRYVLNTIEFGDNDEVFLGTLGPSTSGGGTGNALTLVSPTIMDMAIVLVNGVPAETRKLLPFAVRLRGDDGVIMVGRIEKGDLDDSGAGTVVAELDDLTGFDTVIVRDASGHVIMSGTMRTRAIVASPTP